VTTTAGTKITIPASAATLEKFVDPPSVAAATYGAAGDLANSVQSNFVSIASTQVLDKLKPTPPTALCEKKVSASERFDGFNRSSCDIAQDS
jgi:hypothetical protein